LLIPATYLLGRTLYNRRVAAAAAFLAATTVWTLNLSRVALRAGLLPLGTALSLALLWRGLRLRRPAAMLWAGVAYGLTFYTYLAARFTVLALLLFVLYTLLFRRDLFWLRGWLLFALSGLVVVAPLGIYFIRHWDATLGRAEQVSILNSTVNGGDLWGTLARQIWRTALALFGRGDFIPRHNIPLRPILEPLMAVAALGGIVLACARLRRTPAHVLTLLWVGTMCMPTILAEGAPHMLRGVGVLPLLLLFPALGLEAGFKCVKGGPARQNAAATESAHKWQANAGTRQDAAATKSARERQTNDGARQHAAATESAREWQTNDGARQDAAATGNAHKWQANDERGKTWRRVAATGLVALALMVAAGQNVWAYWQHLHSEAVYYNFEAGATQLAVDINRFLGVGWQGTGLSARNTNTSIQSGRSVYLAARFWENWTSLRYLVPTSEAFNVLDASAPLPANEVADDVLVVLWPYEDPGTALQLLPGGQLISVQEGARERGDLDTESRLLYVTYRSQPAEDLPNNATARWEQGVRLLGYAAQPLDDGTLQVDLYWQTDAPLTAGYTIFCHVLQGGTQVGQHDGPACQGYYGSERWRVGEIVRDRHIISLSVPYDAANAQLVVGLYRWETMEHLAVLDPDGTSTAATSITLTMTWE